MTEEVTVQKAKNVLNSIQLNTEISFKCINKSSLGETFAFCNLCRCEVNIAHGGCDDLRHLVCVNELGNFSLVFSLYCAIC